MTEEEYLEAKRRYREDIPFGVLVDSMAQALNEAGSLTVEDVQTAVCFLFENKDREWRNGQP